MQGVEILHLKLPLTQCSHWYSAEIQPLLEWIWNVIAHQISLIYHCHAHSTELDPRGLNVINEAWFSERFKFSGFGWREQKEDMRVGLFFLRTANQFCRERLCALTSKCNSFDCCRLMVRFPGDGNRI